jgi:hypothetical protein
MDRSHETPLHGDGICWSKVAETASEPCPVILLIIDVKYCSLVRVLSI